MREVVEASVFWGGDLFAVRYFALGERVAFDDVPKAPSVEVRTRVVDAAPKTPRNRWDLPLGALAITAACLNAMVVGSLARHDSAAFGGENEVTYASGDERRVAAEETATAFAAVGLRGARVDGEEMPTGDEGDQDTTKLVDTFGDTGMVAMLAQFRGDGRVAAPWAPSPDESLGALWGDRVGDAWGVGGVALSGVGEGGGGKGLGDAVVDRVHTVAVGGGHGQLTGHHIGWVCHLPVTTAITCYRIPPEIIQRVVRASLGRFRACYADGLKRDPALAGRVVTKFVIARDGMVAAASDGGSDLADDKVRECVQRAFMSLEFPANPDGVGTVTYPIVMSPAE